MNAESQPDLDHEQMINLLGGLNEARNSVRMAKIMRTMTISFDGPTGRGQFWLGDVEKAIELKESTANE
ncbi:hypothetical protein HYG89_14500 [Acinetobacter sp. SwsAc5]|uniref:hypothetical protein n=1 Tax=Acinetobacter sp. SwsAc5 TaxID=2749438 RepID=UPI0015BE9B26|nr:hypothetical protein [Acinetobacter sp. SwsAc5]NWK53733.1 hypothetical protein [Acinetobacter sp. SwsAc5]